MFLTITEGNITTLTGYIGGLIADLMPIILIVLGFTIAMYVFKKITQ
jgi:hypothetical protein